jgi:hypothetical protein
MTEIGTRWGKIRCERERLDQYRHRLTFVGPVDAVTAHVGQLLNRTTQCYEHMFHIKTLTPQGYDLEAVCIENNYAGD